MFWSYLNFLLASSRRRRRASANRQNMRGDSTAPCLMPLVRPMLAVVPMLLMDLKECGTLLNALEKSARVRKA
eukprot:3905831-Rhodomonas_salina.1